MAGMELIAGIAQQQSLSPQMQQSLQLLQTPVAELRQLVAAEMASNPVLEEVTQALEKTESQEFDENPDSDNLRDLRISSLQEEWRDYMPQAASNSSGSFTKDDEDRRRYLFDSQVSRATLREAVIAQAAGFPESERDLVEAIAGNLDHDGYLRILPGDLAATINVPEHELETVLQKIKQFEPPGIAAFDLTECLCLQLSRRGEGNGLAARILRHHLQQLARHRFEEIAKEIRVPLADVAAAARHIATLEPKPGRPFAEADEQGVIPDLIVIPEGDGFVVRLNEDDLPRLRISSEYKDMLAGRGENEELLLYLRDKIRGARVFLRSLQQRQQTLLAIGNQIVERQEEFFHRGAEALRPLIMAQIADAVGLHVTTISRAVSGKYMETPQGLFEMRYFFTPGFQNSDGTSVSNEMVKEAIRDLVEREKSKMPLSDQDIVTRLSERGLKVARRTIAKYREQLGILPSHLRKSY
ncbi:MAG: RNA polymerase factor sigma-54 [Verrucomicrobia bacterium]|nr:MAG: RNA polymerase factor sigma-54 [Verrucomicrobiota bacterium]